MNGIRKDRGQDVETIGPNSVAVPCAGCFRRRGGFPIVQTCYGQQVRPENQKLVPRRRKLAGQ